jgi:hypothetical protein
MDNNHIQRLVDQAMNSMDEANKAEPAPFLLTRINARRQQTAMPRGFWENALALLVKPTVAFPALAIIFALNFWLIKESNSVADGLATEYKLVTNDNYSLSTATSLYDFENLP